MGQSRGYFIGELQTMGLEPYLPKSCIFDCKPRIVYRSTKYAAVLNPPGCAIEVTIMDLVKIRTWRFDNYSAAWSQLNELQTGRYVVKSDDEPQRKARRVRRGIKR